MTEVNEQVVCRILALVEKNTHVIIEEFEKVTKKPFDIGSDEDLAKLCQIVQGAVQVSYNTLITLKDQIMEEEYKDE